MTYAADRLFHDAGAHRRRDARPARALRRSRRASGAPADLPIERFEDAMTDTPANATRRFSADTVVDPTNAVLA